MSHDLTPYAAALAKHRDESLAEARQATTPEGVESWVARAAAFRHALLLLHLYTFGEFGVAIEDQPDPYQVPIMSSQRSGRRTQFIDLFCDADPCGQWADVNEQRGDTASDLRQAARRIGWTRRDGKDYCPKHSEFPAESGGSLTTRARGDRDG